MLLGERQVLFPVGGGRAQEGHVSGGVEEVPVPVKSLLVLGAAAPAATEHGPLQRELSPHREVQVEEHWAEERLPGRDGEEVFTAHRVGGHEETP